MPYRRDSANACFLGAEVRHLRLELRFAGHARDSAEAAHERCTSELSRLQAELDAALAQQAILAEQLSAAARLNEELKAELAATDVELQEMNKEMQRMVDQSLAGRPDWPPDREAAHLMYE